MATRLPAGMRNFNPGNIKYVGQPGTHPSVNTDQGDPQAVYPSAEAGMAAMHQLLAKKYRGGKVTPNMIIAGQGGWTPGNRQAAANVARSMGIGADDDIGFNDPSRAARFMRGLLLQEHGEASNAYSDEMIHAAIGGGGKGATQPVATVQQPASALDPRSDTPSTAQPVGSALPGPPANQYALPSGDRPSESGGARFGGTGLGTPSPITPEVAAKKSRWDALKGLQSAGAPPIPANPGYPLPAQPAAAVVRGEPMPMVNLEQQQMQRQMLAQLLARLNSGSLTG